MSWIIIGATIYAAGAAFTAGWEYAIWMRAYPLIAEDERVRNGIESLFMALFWPFTMIALAVVRPGPPGDKRIWRGWMLPFTKEKSNGHRNANSTGNGGAQGGAGATGSAGAAGAPAAGPGAGQGTGAGRLGFIPPPPMPPPMPPPGGVRLPARGVTLTAAAPTSAPPGATRCGNCGAAYVFDEAAPHECPAPDDVDLLAVRAIQANVIGPGEIDPETLEPAITKKIGVVVGWRVWNVRPDGLYGAGAGEAARWPVNRPIISVCADLRCCGARSRCWMTHGRADVPGCRVHASRFAGSLAGYMGLDCFAYGAVALWGEVVHCTDGFTATRAYPIALSDPEMAEMYGVRRL